MPVTQFSPDQQMAMLDWLENQKAAGLDLEDIIEGLERGYLSTTIVTDYYARFTK